MSENILEKLWVGIGFDGSIVNGGHNRPRLYSKDRANAIKWASTDYRVQKIVEFNVGEVIWEKPKVVQKL